MAEYQPMYDSFSHRRYVDYVPTDRMRISCSVQLRDSEVDFDTGEVKNVVYRRRTQAQRLDEERRQKHLDKRRARIEREAKKRGLRMPMLLGVFIMAFTFIICGFSLLLKQSAIQGLETKINETRASVQTLTQANADLEAQIAEASDQVKILYAAAQNLNMISADAADAIHLVAADPRPRETAQAQTAQASQAQTDEAQTTPVPAIASN